MGINKKESLLQHMPTAVVKSLGSAEGSLLLKDKVEESQPLLFADFPKVVLDGAPSPWSPMRLYKGVGGRAHLGGRGT